MLTLVGCDEDQVDTWQPPELKKELVPLKIVMTDYVFADGGDKFIKFEGSAEYVVPLNSSSSPDCNKVEKKIHYKKLLRPYLDRKSVRIDKLEILNGERGCFTSLKNDNERYNELRKDVGKKMGDFAKDESFEKVAMSNAKDAISGFYKKFGYECVIEWADK